RHLSGSLANTCAFMARDERTPASTHSRNPRMSMFPMTAYQPRAGSKPSTLCCPRLFAFVAVNMCRTIFTHGFPQKERFTDTESGRLPFCLHLSIIVPGTYRVGSTSKF